MVLTILYSVFMPPFVIYSHYMVHRYYDLMGIIEIRDRLEAFVEGSSKKTFHSGMTNVYFLYRRTATVLQLILLWQYPSLQVTILTIFSYVNFAYTALARPYEEHNI
jgi:hypothetical protein